MTNIFEIFSVFFWVSVKGFPNEINLALEMLVDIFLGLDLILRFCLKPYFQKNNNLFFMNFLFMKEEERIKYTTVIKDVLIIISGLPYVTFVTALNYAVSLDLHTNDLYSYLLFFKLFRFCDLWLTKDKILIVLNNFNFMLVIFYRMFTVMIILLLTTHVAACFWLFVNKAESEQFNYFHLYENKYHNLSDQYILALEWAVSTMTGTCFGDVFPTTDIEIFATVIIMVIGSTFYCQIFADFETIIYVLRLENLQKMYIFFKKKN